jgi:hypothetical protein
MIRDRSNSARTMLLQRRVRSRSARSCLVAFCMLVASCTMSNAGAVPWSSGSTSFQFLAPFPPPSGVTASAVFGDLNGDGWPDMVVAWDGGSGRQYVLVRLADGLGGFGPPHLFPQASGYRDVRSGITLTDFDGDGHLDVVSGYWAMHGAGDGTFGTVKFFPYISSAVGTIAPVIGDVNEDGIPDFLILDGGYVRVLLGLGAGVLDSTQYIHPRLSVGNNTRGALTDLNHDGHLDLVVTGDAGWTAVALGAGDGTFGPAAYPSTLGGHFEIADVNGDGNPDILVGTAVLLGNGSGGFASGQSLTLPMLAVGDLNGDGHPDVVMGDTASVVIARGDGAGHFAVSQRLGTGPLPYEAHVADLDLDGHPELVVLSQCGATAQVFENGPTGFLIPPTYPVGAGPVALASLDANHDGIPDLAVGSRGTGLVSLLIGTGGGTFVSGGNTGSAAGISDLCVVDLRGDGQLEIVVACDSANVISVIPVLAGGVLGSRTDLAAGLAPVRLGTGDIDHDGRTDVLAVNQGDNSITIVGADAHGTLSSRTISGFGVAGDKNSSLTVADWSADGNLDLAIGTSGAPGGFHSDVLLSGDGLGGFSSTGNLSSGVANTCAMTAADIDGDGRADLVRAAMYDSAGVHKAVCMGDFFTPGMAPWITAGAYGDYSFIGTPARVVMADVDGDGRPDALITDVEDNALHVVLNAATTFAQGPISLGVGNGPRGLAVDDFDGDGVPDVAITDSHGDDVMLLLSGGRGLPTAVDASLVASDVRGDAAVLRWLVPGSDAVTVERSQVGGAWTALAQVSPDGQRFVNYTDTGLAPGSRYGYRLRLGRGASASTSGDVWLDVPVTDAFALRGALENPSSGPMRVAFSLAGSAPARLQLFDIAGRLIEAAEVGGLGAGAHVYALGAGRPTAPGLYLVRLTSAGRTLGTRVVSLR